MKTTHAPVVTQTTTYDRDDAIVVSAPSIPQAHLAELMVRVAAATPEARTLVIQCTVHCGQTISMPLDASKVTVPTEVLDEALDALDTHLTALGALALTETERSAVRNG